MEEKMKGIEKKKVEKSKYVKKICRWSDGSRCYNGKEPIVFCTGSLRMNSCESFEIGNLFCQ
jgi:hypothetical protein